MEKTQKSTILVIDDDPASINTVMKYLHMSGFKTMVAPGGKRALRQLELFSDLLDSHRHNTQVTGSQSQTLGGYNHVLSCISCILQAEKQHSYIVCNDFPIALRHKSFELIQVHANDEPQRSAKRRLLFARQQNTIELGRKRSLLACAHDRFQHIVSGLFLRIFSH